MQSIILQENKITPQNKNTRKEMTPKEKAKELVSNMIPHQWNKLHSGDAPTIYKQSAKECALIVADELIKDNLHNENIVNGGLNAGYWQEVKTEINNL